MGFLSIFKKKTTHNKANSNNSNDVITSKEMLNNVILEVLRRYNESKNQEEINKLNKIINQKDEMIDILKQTIKDLKNKEVIEPPKQKAKKVKLSQTQEDIYNIYLKNESKTFLEFFNVVKEIIPDMREDTLRVYTSRIKNKGYAMDFKAPTIYKGYKYLSESERRELQKEVKKKKNG